MTMTSRGVAPPRDEASSMRAIVERFISEKLRLPEAIPDRRLQQRFPYCRRVTISPVLDGWGGLSAEESRPVTGYAKDVSPEGIGFFHAVPLPTRRVTVTLLGDDGNELVMLAVLRWCHSVDEEWYLSGGTFVGQVTDEPPA